jgi:signal transduction histidine kinase
MSVVAWRAEHFPEPRALAGVGQVELAIRLTTWMERSKFARQFSVVPTLDQLRYKAAVSFPRVILIEEEILEGAGLEEAVRLFPPASHVIFLAGRNRQAEAAPHVARGTVDFVQEYGDFVGLVAALIERSMAAAARQERLPLPAGIDTSDELSAIFRHEINNPLTGILGNAELLLAHRHQLPPSETQRLQTIVELAVRLRETIRRLSNEWEAGIHTSHAV